MQFLSALTRWIQGFHTDKVSILKVESIQFITRLLRIHDIFVDNKGSAFRVLGNALANLAAQCQKST